MYFYGAKQRALQKNWFKKTSFIQVNNISMLKVTKNLYIISLLKYRPI